MFLRTLFCRCQHLEAKLRSGFGQKNKNVLLCALGLVSLLAEWDGQLLLYAHRMYTLLAALALP